MVVVIVAAAVAGCLDRSAPPPANPGNICEIFAEQPRWYDYARAAEEQWGTPIATQMAFIRQESSFRSHVRPARERLLGILPWRRPSSAYGYAQAQDAAWGDYRREAGGFLPHRAHMQSATDFIGWYNHRTHRELGISLHDPEHLYLAYHEGQYGYSQGRHEDKPPLLRAAARVREHAERYDGQLTACESEFRCRRFYQFGPLCSHALHEPASQPADRG